jgi:hypothetical protein
VKEGFSFLESQKEYLERKPKITNQSCSLPLSGSLFRHIDCTSVNPKQHKYTTLSQVTVSTDMG